MNAVITTDIKAERHITIGNTTHKQWRFFLVINVEHFIQVWDVFIKLNQERYDVRGEYRFDDGPFSALRGSYGHAKYTHTEFEDVGEPGTIFNSDGWETRGELVQRARDGWNGAVGVQALERNFEAIGEEAFVPTTKIDEQGLYTVQRYDHDRYGFETT